MNFKSIIEATPARKALYHLMTGNVLVFTLQIVGLFITLTFYSKEALSIYTLFVTLTYLSTKVTTLRLPEVLIREEDPSEVYANANAILTMTLLLSVGVIGLYFLLTLVGIDFQLFAGSTFSILFPLFALAVLMSSLNQLWGNLLLKHDKTKQISIGRILKSCVQVIVMIYFISRSDFGLLYGWVLGLATELLYAMIIMNKLRLRLTSLSAIGSLISKNRDIISYTLPISILLSLHDNIVVQSIEYFYGPAILAVFAVVDRVLRIPSQIIGGAASQVLYKYGSDTFNQSSSDYYKQFLRGITRVSLLFLVAIVCCMVLASPVFDTLFDGKWKDASEYLIKYAWWILPFSLMAVLRNVPVMLKQQREYFLLELALVMSIGAGLYFVGRQYDIETFYLMKYGLELFFFIVMILSVSRMVKDRATSSSK